jgi:hypothetical protein
VHPSLAGATIGGSAYLQEATKRTLIDIILVLVSAIVFTSLELEGFLELVMELSFDNGKIDYVYRYLQVSIEQQDGIN